MRARSTASEVPELDDSPSSPIQSLDSPLTSPSSPNGQFSAWDSPPSAAQFSGKADSTGAPSQLAEFSDLQLTDELLGQGSFSQVLKARDFHGVYAVKFMRKGVVGDLNLEAHVLKKLNDPGNRGVIRLLGAWNGGLVLPLYDGSLYEAVRLAADTEQAQLGEYGIGQLTQPLCGLERWRSWARQLVAALAYVHSKGVVHGDIKPQNILYSSSTGDLVLADFAGAAGGHSTNVFSVLYAHPAVRGGGEPTPAGDVYSLGVVLLFCATGLEPYSDAKNARQRLMWMDKVAPAESYGPEYSLRFQHLGVDRLLHAAPPTAAELIGTF